MYNDNLELYPLLLSVNLKELIWGKEEWFISVLPGFESIIINGKFSSKRLSDIVSIFPNEILGYKVAKRYNNKFPLLAKIINANLDLSIQVHPNDTMADRLYGENGKSEIWYILDAHHNAYIYSGFKEKLNDKDFIELLDNNSITQVLSKHKVEKGDVFFIPAGRIHAICGGVKLIEIQQSSDITFRVYDYNRRDMNGKLRDLHTDLALQALDFSVLDDYKTRYNRTGIVNPILEFEHFNINIINTTQYIERELKVHDSFIILIIIEGSCDITFADSDIMITLDKMSSCLIPAVLANYIIQPKKDIKLLEVYIS